MEKSILAIIEGEQSFNELQERYLLPIVATRHVEVQQFSEVGAVISENLLKVIYEILFLQVYLVFGEINLSGL